MDNGIPPAGISAKGGEGVNPVLKSSEGEGQCPHCAHRRTLTDPTAGWLSHRPITTDLNVYDKRHLKAVAAEVNARPRRVLDWASPTGLFDKLLTEAQSQ